MIRVRWERSEGHMLIEVDGHTDEIVCAAASGMTQAAVAGLMSLAATFPDKVECVEQRIRNNDDLRVDA